MTSIEVLCEMERKLDELITNATLLKDCEEEKGERVDLEHKQEMLLNALLKINNSLDDSEKHLLWQKSPQRYSTLERKIVKFSRLNQTMLKKERFVRKARVHRRKIKKPPTQLSFDLGQ